MYSIVIDRYAIKQLKLLPSNDVQKIKQKISELGNEPRPSGCIKLKGIDAYRIRVGDYRIIYEIRDKQLIINVVAIGHRKDIYQ